MGKNFQESELEGYIRAAEELYRGIDDTTHLMIRPVYDLQRTSLYYYRVGILLNGLDVGFHRVLDFGAGSCWLSIILNRMGALPVCLEVSPTALKLGKKLFKRHPYLRKDRKPKFLTYDGITFPIEDNSIDRIISFDAFHHIPNRLQILKEMHRVLEDGGRVGLSEPSTSHNESEYAEFERQTKHVVEDGVDPFELKELAREAGFSQVYFKPFPKPENVWMDESKFQDFCDGNDSVYPAQLIREDQNFLIFAFLQKGKFTPDTRKPNDLRADIKLLDGAVEAKRHTSFEHKIRLTNIGDTTWLHKTPLEGDVILEGRFLSDKGEDTGKKYFTKPLPKPVKSTRSIDIEISGHTPKKAGNYVLEYDLRIKGRFRFSNLNINPHNSKSLKIDFKVL